MATESTKETNPFDGIIDTYVNAIEIWKKNNPPEKIEQAVQAMLDKESQQLTVKLLGFDNRWGKWEIDHCNGRAGESAAGDYLRKTQQQAIQDWFSKMKMPQMSAALKKEMNAFAVEKYTKGLKEAITAAVQQQITQDTQRIMASMNSSDALAPYQQAMKLLNPNL